MTYLESLGLIVSGAGTLASVLGIFFAVYAKHNGRLTREFLAEFIAAQNREMRDFTAELLTKFDERAEIRHREMIEAIKR
jgi:hypothetical protein